MWATSFLSQLGLLTHSQSTVPFTFATPLFTPQQLFPVFSLNRKAATAVGCVFMLLLRGQTGVAKYIAAISFCSAVDSFKTFHLPSV